MNREALIAAFPGAHGFGAARAEPLAQDASFRRYLRLTGGPAPGGADGCAAAGGYPAVRAALPRIWRRIGLSVPEIFAADEAAGLLLEEDLGDESRLGHLSYPRGEVYGQCAAVALFDAAVDALVAMQRAAPPPDLPAWDAAAMATTALATLFDWWWPAMFGATAPDAGARRTSPRHSRPCWPPSPPARSASCIATSSPAT